MPTIRLEKATKFFKWEGRTHAAVDEASLQVEQGEFVFLVGSSGAGKSTLLKLVTGELKPDQGVVYLNEMNLARVPAWRRHRVYLTFGQVWQEPMLIRKRTVYENLAVAVRVGHTDQRRMKQRIQKALGVVGMPNVEDRYPGELSIGESRRVELARALINSPPILILDEVTANLDPDTTWDIFQLLIELNRQGTTILMATHASEMVNIMRRRVVTLVDGRIFGDVPKGRYGDIVG
ncbi:MAG TPA: ATP-binding cassette domain-containing protein [Firmicutes bacterium]|nr:ATP-binding cassette domain-containing protein [Bacillota bacterium]